MNDFDRLHSMKSLAPFDPGHDLDIQQWLTDEGARVLFISARELPMLDIRLNFAAGNCRDGEVHGAAFLTLSMLDEGVAGLDAQPIADLFEGTGAALETYLGVDHAVISLRCLSEQALLDTAVDTLARVVGQPSFPAPAIPLAKSLCTDFLDAREQAPRYQLQRHIYQHLYTNHPYGRPRYGDRAGIAALSREDLLAFHKTHYTAPNLSISLVGDLSLAQARSIAAKISASLPNGPAMPEIPRPPASEPEVIHVDTDGGQAIVVLLLPAMMRHSLDYAAMSVANDIFGGGAHSRLFNELRNRRGLSYSPASDLIYSLADSRFVISWQCAAQYNSASQDLVEGMLKTYIAHGPTEQELEQSIQRILRSSPLRIATNKAKLDQLALLNAFELPLGHIDDFHRQVKALTLSEVHAAIRRNLQAEHLLYASVGPDAGRATLPEPG